MTIKNTLRGYLADAVRAFDKAPVEVALALATAVAISYSIETQHVETAAFQFAFAAVLIGAVAWSATLLYGLDTLTFGGRWIITLAGAVAGSLYLLLVPELDTAAEAWRVLMLLSTALLIVFAVPGWAPLQSDANLRLRRVNGRVLLRAIGIALYGLALFGGLALALLSINNLFELKLEDKIYAHVFTWIMVVLVPWVIVGGLDDYVQQLDAQSDVARVVHRLTGFLVPPLVAIYYLILVAYAIRIAITGELPQNLVSPMVIAAGLLAAVALILFDPAPDANAGMRWLRFMPILFVLLSPLAVWALYARIDAYGWTEFRLLRLILLVELLVLALLAIVQLVRRRAFALRVIPLFLGIVVFLCAIGPWSVLDVARRDQQHRLVSALHRANVNPAVLPSPADTTRRVIARELYSQINSTSAYLAGHFGERALPAEIPATARRQRVVRLLADSYHLTPAMSDTAEVSFSGSLARGALVPLDSSRIAYRLLYNASRKDADPRIVNDTLTALVAGERVYVPLSDVLSRARQQVLTERELPATAASARVYDASGKRRGDLIVFDLTFSEKKKGRKVTNLDGLLLLTR